MTLPYLFGGSGALALPVEEVGAEGQAVGAGGGGEEDFAFAQGDEQQVGGVLSRD